jgi:hypothetical protein
MHAPTSNVRDHPSPPQPDLSLPDIATFISINPLASLSIHALGHGTQWPIRGCVGIRFSSALVHFAPLQRLFPLPRDPVFIFFFFFFFFFFFLASHPLLHGTTTFRNEKPTDDASSHYTFSSSPAIPAERRGRPSFADIFISMANCGTRSLSRARVCAPASRKIQFSALAPGPISALGQTVKSPPAAALLHTVSFRERGPGWRCLPGDDGDAKSLASCIAPRDDGLVARGGGGPQRPRRWRRE